MNIRPMQASDIAFAFECTRKEGWSGETEESFAGFLEHDPEGCFIAEIDGRPIGLCTATSYTENGFIGELIIVKAERGRGYGRTLFEHAVSYCREKGIHSIFLDGDLEAVPIYEKSGFRKVCRSLRFLGQVSGSDHPAVRHLRAGDIDSICGIDRRLFGDDRSFFLRRRQRIAPRLCFVQERQGSIAGYVMAVPGVGVVSVGPYAFLDSDGDPFILLKKLAMETEGRPLRMGVLESNGRWVESVRACGDFVEQTPCWRMVLGREGDLGNHEHLLAIGSAAKG